MCEHYLHGTAHLSINKDIRLIPCDCHFLNTECALLVLYFFKLEIWTTKPEVYTVWWAIDGQVAWQICRMQTHLGQLCFYDYQLTGLRPLAPYIFVCVMLSPFIFAYDGVAIPIPRRHLVRAIWLNRLSHKTGTTCHPTMLYYVHWWIESLSFATT